jgi:hypothetical protein
MEQGMRQTVAGMAVAVVTLEVLALVMLGVAVVANPSHLAWLFRAGLGAAALGFATGTVLQFLILRSPAGARLSRWRRGVKYVYFAVRLVVVAFLVMVAIH